MKPVTVIALFALSFISAVAAPEITFSVPRPPAVVANENLADDVLLECIAQEETGGNPWRVGALRERTAYQFRPATWRQYSKRSHRYSAGDPDEAKRVALAFLADIRLSLARRGYPPTPYYIAVSWNAGPNFTRIPAGTRAYAQRVSNMFEMQTASRDVVARAAAVEAKRFLLPDVTEAGTAMPTVVATTTPALPTAKPTRVDHGTPPPLFAVILN